MKSFIINSGTLTQHAVSYSNEKITHMDLYFCRILNLPNFIVLVNYIPQK